MPTATVCAGGVRASKGSTGEDSNEQSSVNSHDEDQMKVQVVNLYF